MPKSPRLCIYCRKNPATLVMQHCCTNAGKPVDDKTFQIRARPNLCDVCVEDIGFRDKQITDSYAQCKQATLLAARLPAKERPTIMYRSKKKWTTRN